MVRHIVAWNHLDGLSEKQAKENALEIKNRLESLAGKIDGIVQIRVYVNLLPPSDREVVLNVLFESEEALAAYKIHPEHVKVGAFVKSVMQERICIDYNE